MVEDMVDYNSIVERLENPRRVVLPQHRLLEMLHPHQDFGVPPMWQCLHITNDLLKDASRLFRNRMAQVAVENTVLPQSNVSEMTVVDDAEFFINRGESWFLSEHAVMTGFRHIVSFKSNPTLFSVTATWRVIDACAGFVSYDILGYISLQYSARLIQRWWRITCCRVSTAWAMDKNIREEV